uniref:Uncharacterized protein n=1 Tax=Glossina austeni TaxID=7395 RepID=A0A1A9UXQ4_GLOAU
MNRYRSEEEGVKDLYYLKVERQIIKISLNYFYLYYYSFYFIVIIICAAFAAIDLVNTASNSTYFRNQHRKDYRNKFRTFRSSCYVCQINQNQLNKAMRIVIKFQVEISQELMKSGPITLVTVV